MNKNREVVLDMLEKILTNKSDDICRCQICVLDMAAIALNQLKPRYHTSPFAGEEFKSESDREAYFKEVREAIAYAIERVRKYPHHTGR